MMSPFETCKTLCRNPLRGSVIFYFVIILVNFTPPRSPEPRWDCHMTSNDHTPRRELARKRSRERSSSSSAGFPDYSSSRQRILIQDSDIDNKVLLKISDKCGPSKFMELGIRLGLDYHTINNRASGQEGEMKVFEVLQAWKQRGVRVSYEVLAQALEEMGLSETASRYCYTTVTMDTTPY